MDEHLPRGSLLPATRRMLPVWQRSPEKYLGKDIARSHSSMGRCSGQRAVGSREGWTPSTAVATSGSNVQAVTAVIFGTLAADSFSADSDSQITAEPRDADGRGCGCDRHLGRGHGGHGIGGPVRVRVRRRIYQLRTRKGDI